jgi:hypothetical protein
VPLFTAVAVGIGVAVGAEVGTGVAVGTEVGTGVAVPPPFPLAVEVGVVELLLVVLEVLLPQAARNISRPVSNRRCSWKDRVCFFPNMNITRSSFSGCTKNAIYKMLL